MSDDNPRRREIILLGPTHVQPVLDLGRAREALHHSSTSTCIVLDGETAPSPESSLPQLTSNALERWRQYATRLRLNAEHPQVSFYVSCSSTGGARVAALVQGARLSTVRVLSPSAISVLASHTTTEDFREVAAQVRTAFSALPEDGAQILQERLPRALAQVLRTQLGNLSATWVFNGSSAIDDPSEARAYMAALLGQRATLAEVARVAHELNDEGASSAVHALMDELDSFGQLVSAVMTTDILELTRIDHDATVKRDREATEANARRESLLASYLAAFVAPTLWLTYWATKVAPNVDGLLWNLLVIIVAIILIPAGFYLTQRLRFAQSQTQPSDEHKGQ